MKPLTPQEKKVLDLVAQGHNSVHIGRMLCISAYTVESHRKNLLTKFDAKNSAELIRKAIYANLLNSGQEEATNPSTI